MLTTNALCSRCGLGSNPLAKKLGGLDSWCKPCRSAATARYFKTPKGKFVNQKNGARVRGIEWTMTFEEWWELWEPHWSNRGHGAGKLQLCRIGDNGPYSTDNVYIASHEKNVADSWRNGKHD